MAKRAVDGAREQLWRERVQRWKSSGQSVRAFCASESLQEPAFYFWRRVIAERDGAARRRPGKPKFVPVRVTSPSVGVEVVAANGRVVKVYPGFEGRKGVRNLFLLSGHRFLTPFPNSRHAITRDSLKLMQ